MGEVYIRGVELPPKIKGSVIKREDDFIVLVNTLLTEECQMKAVKHELDHVIEDHFYDEKPVVVNELHACAVR